MTMLDPPLAEMVRQRLVDRLSQILTGIPSACAELVRAGVPAGDAFRAVAERAAREIDAAVAEAELALAEAVRAPRQ